jgi:L,D-peptidoglycan transpeptidase YkuD (ErfK/YbiS/YcfS/YnhG family)
MLTVVALTAAACSSGPVHPQAARVTLAPGPDTTTTLRPEPTTTVPPAPATTVAPTTPTAVVAPTTTTTTTTTATPPPRAPPTTTTPDPSALPVAVGYVGGSGQVVVVTAPSYGDTVGTLTAYQQTTGGWQAVLGPWPADLGWNGFAPPGAKHEGDGRTPSGSFTFGFLFGVDPDPGDAVVFRPVTGPDIVWDDDPGSPDYNQWVDESTQGVATAGAGPEPMDNTPYYDYGAVIDYNADPVVPGAGSAIFLHVTTGGTTAGCVAVPEADLLQVLHWMDPSLDPRIVMGTAATVADG